MTIASAPCPWAGSDGPSRLTRRDLLRAIPAGALLPRVLGAQTGPPLLMTRAMNHVTLTVTDPKRSLAFYQTLLGLPVVAMQGPVPILRVGAGPQFIALSGGPNATPRINHVCLTIDRFDAVGTMKALEGHGVSPAAAQPQAGGGALKARIRMRGENAGGAQEGTPELYFGDPDNIVIQLQAAEYCGGAGVLGERCSATASAADAPIVTREVNHVTLNVTDPKRSLVFYQRVFGLPVVAMQAATQVLRVGPGPSFIALRGTPVATPGIDHVCLTVENFSVDRIMTALAAQGITRVEQGAGQVDGRRQAPLTARVRMRGSEAGGAKEGTPELYITDPDGIVIQLQDPTYCGGAGVLGNVCRS